MYLEKENKKKTNQSKKQESTYTHNYRKTHTHKHTDRTWFDSNQLDSPRSDAVHTYPIWSPFTRPISRDLVHGCFGSGVGRPRFHARHTGNGPNVDHRRCLATALGSFQEFVAGRRQPKHAFEIGIQDKVQIVLCVVDGWFANIRSHVVDQNIQRTTAAAAAAAATTTSTKEGFDILNESISSFFRGNVGNDTVDIHPLLATSVQKGFEFVPVPTAG